MEIEVSNVSVHYAGAQALRAVSLEVSAGSLVAIIGSNGAGKTTLLRAISGLKEVGSGDILVLGQRINGKRPDQIARLGLAHCPERGKVFHGMTVKENLMAGAFLRNNQAEKKADLEWVFGLFPKLKERINQKGGTLSGGEQQMLAIGRALMSRPKVMMFDEPSLGLSPIMADAVMGKIKELRSQGLSILLVEQNSTLALSICDRAYVLESGAITLQGTGQELLNNDMVRKAYLGM